MTPVPVSPSLRPLLPSDCVGSKRIVVFEENVLAYLLQSAHWSLSRVKCPIFLAESPERMVIHPTGREPDRVELGVVAALHPAQSRLWNRPGDVPW